MFGHLVSGFLSSVEQCLLGWKDLSCLVNSFIDCASSWWWFSSEAKLIDVSWQLIAVQVSIATEVICFWWVLVLQEPGSLGCGVSWSWLSPYRRPPTPTCAQSWCRGSADKQVVFSGNWSTWYIRICLQGFLRLGQARLDITWGTPGNCRVMILFMWIHSNLYMYFLRNMVEEMSCKPNLK